MSPTITAEPDSRGGVPPAPEHPAEHGAEEGTSLTRKLAQGAGVTFVIYAGGAAAGYATQTLLARWVGAAGYGAFSWVATWGEILGLLAGLGLGVGCLRFVPEYDAKGRPDLARGFARFSYGLTIVVATLLALLLGQLPVPRLLAGPTLQGVWHAGVWLVPAIAITQLQMQLARARGHAFLAFAPRMLLRHLVFLAIAGGVLMRGGQLDATAAMQLTLFSYGLVLLGQGLVLRKSRRFAAGAQTTLDPATSPGRGTEGPLPVGHWMRVSTTLLLGSVFVLLQQRTDVLVLGLIGEASEVGVYNAASKTAGLASFVLIAANAAVAPSISALHATGRRVELQRVLSRFGRWIVLLSIVVVAGLVFCGPWILAVFGEEFTAGFVPLVILLTGYLAAAGCGLVLDLLNLTGHQDSVVRVVVGATVVNVVLNAALISLYGMTGAAIATSLSMAGMYLALRALAIRRTGIDPSGLAAFLGLRPSPEVVASEGTEEER